MNGFDKFKLDPRVLKALDRMGLKEPTEVQKKAIPVALRGQDLIVKSKTGSGKTASFAIPIIDSLDWEENRPQGLVITPTRELAVQISEDIKNIGRFKKIKSLAIYGKSPMDRQVRDLKTKTHIVVGTPGRILDHIERKTIDLSQVEYLVIDEADELFSMGFLEDVIRIINETREERQLMLFSATLDKETLSITEDYIRDGELIEIESEALSHSNIEERVIILENEDRMEALRKLLLYESAERAIIFTNTKNNVNRIYDSLKSQGYSVNRIHGDMKQAARLAILDSFKEGDFRYLIATDVLGRGIHIDKIPLVVNYECPRAKEAYVHRIGRTGRQEEKGRALSLIYQDELKSFSLIEKFRSYSIDKLPLSSLDIDRDKEEAFEKMMKTPVLSRDDKIKKLNQGITKLHINAGKKTKMRPGDIVGAISNIEGVDFKDIGIIDVIDRSSFVEILNDKGDLVLEALQTKAIKGRVREVTVTKKKRPNL